MSSGHLGAAHVSRVSIEIALTCPCCCLWLVVSRLVARSSLLHVPCAMLLTVDTTMRTLHNYSHILHTREQPLVADTSHTTITADVRGSDKF
jgi:hypothetical protein